MHEYDKVTPPEMVKVHYKGMWLGGELRARWKNREGTWRGLVKFYLPGGGSQYWWFEDEHISSVS